MKLYFNVCSILFSILSFSGVACAELATSKETPPAETEVTTETASEKSEEEQLRKAFPNCPVTEAELQNLAVEQNNEQPIVESESETIEKTENISNETEEEAAKDQQETETAADNQEPKCPTLEEIARYQKFVQADRLYLAGNKKAATQIYRQLKEPWDTEEIAEKKAPAIYQVAELSPGGKVYWRTYQQGKKQQLESKIFAPLELIVTKDPNFIPGHIAYTEELMARERATEAYAVMEKAIGLYPQEITLLKAKIATDVQGERWLDASISARQFALFNPDLPEAKEFATLADQYLQEYQKQIKEELTWNAIGNAITGAAGFALTGNLYGPISAIDTTIMLLQGEAKLGDRFAQRANKQLPMVEDEAVLNYVRQVGQKIAAVAGRDEFEYEFFVVMDDNLNAFALPGGKIFVNIGAILNTDSEAELAGLLAHEVAHSVLSHGFQLVTRGNLTANVAQYIPYVGSTASNLIVMNYSRDMEKQADIFGTRILVAADYAADGVRNLMAKLGEIHAEDEENPEPPVWLSTHPNTQQRVSYIEELVVNNNLNRYRYEGVAQHQKIKNITYKLWQEYQAEQEKKETESSN